tara:strand:- start:155 stop:550 length:396 start_codon:yes stop_codon:yes gene_type:complete
VKKLCQGWGQGRVFKKHFYRCEMNKLTDPQEDGLNRLFNNYININGNDEYDPFDAKTKKFVDSKKNPRSVFHRAKDEIRAEAAKEKNGEGGRKKRTRKRIKKKYKKRRTKKKKKRTKKKRRKRRKKTRRRK